jgi:transcription elongation factor S-II
MKIDRDIRKNTIKELDAIIDNELISKNVEKSLYMFAKEYSEINSLVNTNELSLIYAIYNDKKNFLLVNLKNNNVFLNKVLTNVFNSSELAYLESIDIDPDHWKDIADRQLYREDKMKNIATTNMFTCDKCNESRCTVTQMQTRSNDEPMTVFVECHVCGYTFTV